MAAGALGQRPGSDRGRYTRTHTVMHFQSTLRGFLEHFTPSTTTFIFSVKSTGVVSQGKEPPTIPHMPECTLKPSTCFPPRAVSEKQAFLPSLIVDTMYSYTLSAQRGGSSVSGRSVLRAFRNVSPGFSMGATSVPIAISVETFLKAPPPGGVTIHKHHLYAAIQF